MEKEQKLHDQEINLGKLFSLAREQVANIYPIEKHNSDIRLEQVEYNEEEEVWEIVVSYLMEVVNESKPNLALTFSLGDAKLERVYKTLKIDHEGKLRGFYIYKR